MYTMFYLPTSLGPNGKPPKHVFDTTSQPYQCICSQEQTPIQSARSNMHLSEETERQTDGAGSYSFPP
jgi:hypothetical protein